MKTKVVNLYKERFDVYIGRPSKWGNPFHIKKFGREECIKKYKKYLLSRKDLIKDLKELKGKVLGCYCKPKRCHGDVIIEVMKELKIL